MTLDFGYLLLAAALLIVHVFVLCQECEELMSKGITGTGQGFDVPGKRLGGFSRQPPLSSLRATAATAAEKRVRAGNLLPSGPQRLGGDSSIMSHLSPIQAAAMSAERRFLDDLWCGSQSAEALEDQENDSHACAEPFTSLNARPAKRSSSCSNATNSFPPSSSHQWGSDVIDLTEEASETRCSKRSCSPGDQVPSSSSKDEPISGVMKSSETSPSTSYNENQGREEPAMWQCAECTLLNPVTLVNKIMSSEIVCFFELKIEASCYLLRRIHLLSCLFWSSCWLRYASYALRQSQRKGR